MKGFSPGQITTLSSNGAVTRMVLGLWGETGNPCSTAWDLFNEEKRARFWLLIIGLAVTVFITFLAIFFYLTSNDDFMLRRGAMVLIIVSGCITAGLAGLVITLALKVNRSRHFQLDSGEFGYEYAALVEALIEVGRDWVDSTWTAGKLAQSNLELLKGRVNEVLSKRAAALQAAELAQRETPDNPTRIANVERERADFKEGFRVFVRFNLVDKSLGWTPYFPKPQVATVA